MIKDPLRDPGSDIGRELFMKFVQAANGRPVEDVLAACANIIANCLRQSYGLRSEVEGRMKELFERSMAALLEHYDPVTGRRRSVIPFDQSIRPEPILSEDIFTNLGDRRKGH